MNLQLCAKAVETAFHVPVRLQRSPARDRRTAFARFATMWLARRYFGISYPRIGAFLGRRDHTTVMHGVVRATEMRESDDDFRSCLNAAQRFLSQNEIGLNADEFVARLEKLTA